MGVATGCGCKEVYIFPLSTNPYSSCICSFFTAAFLRFVHFLIFFRSLIIIIKLRQIENRREKRRNGEEKERNNLNSTSTVMTLFIPIINNYYS